MLHVCIFEYVHMRDVSVINIACVEKGSIPSPSSYIEKLLQKNIFTSFGPSGFCQALHSVSVDCLGLSRNKGIPKFFWQCFIRHDHRSTGFGVLWTNETNPYLFMLLPVEETIQTCARNLSTLRFHNPKTYPWSCELNLGEDGFFLCFWCRTGSGSWYI